MFAYLAVNIYQCHREAFSHGKSQASRLSRTQTTKRSSVILLFSFLPDILITLLNSLTFLPFQPFALGNFRLPQLPTLRTPRLPIQPLKMGRWSSRTSPNEPPSEISSIADLDYLIS